MSIATGLIPIDEVVYFDICTHDPSTGAVSDADSTPSFSVFEEATDTPIVSGTSFTKRTSLTGDYRGTFTASAANGFEAGKWYSVIASATVGAIAAKKNCGSFRVAPAEAVAGVLKCDASYFAGQTITAAAGVTVPASLASPTNITAATGVVLSAAGVQAIWDALSSALTSVGSIGKRLVDDLTGDIFARLGAPAGASVAADVAAVKAVLPAALVSGRIDASVGAMASGVVTATAIAADAITAAKIADGAIDAATFAAGAINAAAIAADAITDAKVAADVTIASVTGSVGSVTGAVGSVTAGVTVGTNNDKTGYRLSATGVDDVWDEVQSGHSTPGTFGKYLDSAISGVSTGGVTAGDIADAVLDELLSGHTTSGSLGKAVSDILAAVDTEIAAIKAKTDALPSDPADASDIAASFSTISTTLATIAAYIDTEVAAIKVKTDRLTFTSGNDLDVNVQKINDTTLLGDGSATPFGPA